MDANKLPSRNMEVWQLKQLAAALKAAVDSAKGLSTVPVHGPLAQACASCKARMAELGIKDYWLK